MKSPGHLKWADASAIQALGVVQDLGLASVLVTELGLETVLKLDAAARPGQALSISCLDVDMGTGEYRLTAEISRN